MGHRTETGTPLATRETLSFDCSPFADPRRVPLIQAVYACVKLLTKVMLTDGGVRLNRRRRATDLDSMGDGFHAATRLPHLSSKPLTVSIACNTPLTSSAISPSRIADATAPGD